jgi:hypothetical protein
VEARKGARNGRYCLKCTKEVFIPRRLRATSIEVCPFCTHTDLFWGTWSGFIFRLAKDGQRQLPQDVGEAIGKALPSHRN